MNAYRDIDGWHGVIVKNRLLGDWGKRCPGVRAASNQAAISIGREVIKSA